MKAAAFSYARATSVVNALELLVAHGDKAKVLLALGIKRAAAAS